MITILRNFKRKRMQQQYIIRYKVATFLKHIQNYEKDIYKVTVQTNIEKQEQVEIIKTYK